VKYYAGIGARKTPIEILQVMTGIARIMDRMGYVLRSGGAEGADSAFEMGSSENKEIYLPWKGFNGNDSPLYECYSDFHKTIAERFHPKWGSLSHGAKKMMIRNTAQIFGTDCSGREASGIVICWTPNGKACGGTGQAIRIANHYKIPVINLQQVRELLFEDEDCLYNLCSDWIKQANS